MHKRTDKICICYKVIQNKHGEIALTNTFLEFYKILNIKVPDISQVAYVYINYGLVPQFVLN